VTAGPAGDRASWAGRSAVVTGASRGIGRAVALALAERGATLVLTARDRELLDETAERCRAAGAGEVRTVAGDLVAPETTDAVAAQVGERLALLANVAGSALRRAAVEELDDADWEASMALHVIAPARLQRLCRPALVAGEGSVVNVGSIAAAGGIRQGAAYSAAKAALVAMTKTTAIEWARDGVRANVVEPGYVDTDFNAPAIAAGLEERMLRRVPTGRAISPEAIARAVLFLAGPDARDVTGTVLRVDGGWTARR
jgi:NAD(P)-dependent dehydrogenase (short-subunit alcohol dehydrogenase family)